MSEGLLRRKKQLKTNDKNDKPHNAAKHAVSP